MAANYCTVLYFNIPESNQLRRSGYWAHRTSPPAPRVVHTHKDIYLSSTRFSDTWDIAPTRVMTTTTMKESELPTAVGASHQGGAT